MQRFRMRQYQKSILFAFFMIVLLAAMLFTLLMTFSAKNILEKNYHAEKLLRVEQMSQLADEVIYTTSHSLVRDMQYQYLFSGSAAFRQLMDHGYLHNMKTVYQLCKNLKTITASSDAVSSIVFYFPADGCIVSADGFLTYSRNRRYSYLVDFAASPLNEDWIRQTTVDSTGIALDVMTYMKKLTVRSPQSGQSSIAILGIDIPDQNYLQRIDPLTDAGQDTLFVLGRDGSVLFSSGAMTACAADGQMFSLQEFPKHLNISGTNVLVSQKHSDTSGWRFILLSVIVLLIAAVILSRILYRPFQTLLQKIGADTGDKKDEMKIIDESFQNLNQMLDKASEQMQETQWYRLLHDPMEDGHILEPECSMRFSQYYVLVVLFGQTVRHSWLEQNLSRILGDSYDLAVVPLANNTFAIILNTDFDETESARQAQDALAQLTAEDKLSFWAGMGEDQDTLYTLALSYRESVDALENKALYRDGMFLTYSEQSAWPDFDEPVPIEALTAAIRSGESTKALAVFDGFLQKLTGSGEHWSIHSIENAVSLLYYNLRDISNRLQLYGHIAPPEDFRRDLKQDLSGVTDQLRRTVASMVQVQSEPLPSGQNVVLERIRSYIDGNLNQDLSLPVLADIGGQNVSYVSTQFKKTYGIGIVQYVNQKRLEKACELLSTTDMNVDEVARSVGFQNTSYFIKRFSQAYQITPKNYKLQNRPQAANAD